MQLRFAREYIDRTRGIGTHLQIWWEFKRLKGETLNLIQSLIRKTPANMSHIIIEKIRVSPNNIIRPSRVVNFDRFIAPLPKKRGENKAGQFSLSCHFGERAPAKSGIQFERSASAVRHSASR